MLLSEAVAQRCSVKKAFLKISQNSQENTYARVSLLIKPEAACNFVKKEALALVFSCEFCEFLRTSFFIEYLRWLFLCFIALIVYLIKDIMKAYFCYCHTLF